MSEKKQPSLCRSCKAEMYWCITPDGKNMPVNAKPDPVGGFVVTQKSDGKLYAEPYYPAQHPSRNRFTSHFATCPDAGSWRSNRRES